MKKSLLLAGVFLLGAASVGGALAAGDLLDRHHGPRAEATGLSRFGDTFRVADDDHHRRRDGEHHRSRHDDDEDDDDEGGRAGAGRPSVTGTTDPAAPVPDNGLFQGKARPKVEVN
ncbi:MAG: hypothetical protein GX458_21975 [Phyllobacteriaceae bacterium]|nr:hypothetical protein [Phyllobacteriaceae bacterium]